MNFTLGHSTARQDLRHPQPARVPAWSELLVYARYRSARIGGDFYDFVEVSNTRLLFVLLDIAGKKDEALHIAAAAQEVMRDCGPELLGSSDVNVADALTDLLLDMNRAIIAAANGVRCAPAFLGCYDSDYGLLHYCNAGHTPAFLKDATGVTLLESNGLPLGLFSHATHDAQLSAVIPGAALVLVSKGLIEARSGHEEFGIQRVKEIIQNTALTDGNAICSELLTAVHNFEHQPSHFGPHLNVPGFRHNHEPNDSTVVAMLRARTAAAAAG